MSKTSIEWTSHVWNPIVGCSIVPPGCTNCYAMKTAARNEAMGISRYDGTTRVVNGNALWTGKLVQAPEATLLQPLKRKKPTTYFVNSMSDLFHEDCPDAWIDRVFAVMALCPQHTFQVLTKRARRMRDYCVRTSRHTINGHIWSMLGTPEGSKINHGGDWQVNWPLPNVWLGVSAERQQEADERIPLLLQTPAAVRFISGEPLLGPIDLTAIPWAMRGFVPDRKTVRERYNVLTGSDRREHLHEDGTWSHRRADGTGSHSVWSTNCGPRLDWVIVGGESGPRARPMHVDWDRSLRDQCQAAGVPFFFKQWGEWAPSTPEQAKGNPRSGWQAIKAYPHVARADELYPEAGAAFVERVGKARAGRLLDDVEHNAMPERRP